MGEQIDQLKSRQKRQDLTVKKRKFIGIHKLEARTDPYSIPSTQRYYPFKGETPGPGITLGHKNSRDRTSIKDFARVRSRKVGLPIKVPATHEVHLVADTFTASMEAVQDPKTKIAVVFNIGGNVRGLLKRRGGITAIIVGSEGQEELYYILQWQDVLEDPFREPPPETKQENDKLLKRKLDRSRYPTDSLARMAEGRKVYYLSQGTPDELKLILAAFRSGE